METPPDSTVFQKEWSVKTGIRENGVLLLIALFSGNIGPGLFMISVLSGIFVDYYYMGFVVSFFIAVLGYGLPHALFLGKKLRFWRAVTRPGSSWISRGFIFATLFMVFSFLTSIYFYISNIYQISGALSSLHYILLYGGFISAFFFSLYPGFVFSSVRAIPFWNSFLIVPLFLIQSFGAGIALAFAITHSSGISVEGIERLLPYEAIIIIVSAVLIAGYLYSRYRTGNAGRDSVKELLIGRYSRLFLIGAILCEIVIPLVFVSLTFFGISLIMLVVAEFIQLIGIFVFKFCFIHAGAYNPLVGKKLTPDLLYKENRSP